MMKTDLDKWLKYRKSQYDKLLRQRAPALYKQLSALSAKQATVIMLDNLLMVISFVRAVESFLQENENVLERKNMLKLQKIIISHHKTISMLQTDAQRLNFISSDISTFFDCETFTNEKIYFERIKMLFVSCGFLLDI